MLENDKSLTYNLLLSASSILEENNIYYTLAYGSVLGAVRHKGFIPWDYDIDIYISTDDFQKTVDILDKNLPNNLCVRSILNDEKYEEVVARVCYRDIPHQNMHVDIFLLSGAPDNVISQKVIWFISYFSHRCIFVKSVNPFFNYKNNKRKLLICLLLKLVLLPLPRSIFIKIFLNLCERLKMDHYHKVYSICGCWSYGFWPKEWFVEHCLMEFNKKMFPVPKEWDLYLTKYYGDYMKPKKY